MFSSKFVENIKTYFMFNIFFLNRALYEIMCKNIVETARSRTTTWSMRIACWRTKGTNTLSEYVIFIVVPLKQWLHECSSLLRYTCIACLVIDGEGPLSHSLEPSSKPYRIPVNQTNFSLIILCLF